MKSLFVRIIALVLLVLTTSTAYAQQVYYLPILQATNEADLGIAFSNPTLSEVTVTATARSYIGETISGSTITNPATVRVPASGQRAIRAAELFGEGIVGKSGWIEIRTSSPLIKGFVLLFDSQLSFLDGADLQSAPSSKLIFPKVSTRSDSATNISLVHTGSDTLRFASATFYDNSGRIIAQEYLDLAPRSGFSGPVTALLPRAAPAEGYIVVDTAGLPISPSQPTLVGLETYRDRSDIALLNGFSESSQLRSGYLAHFAVHGDYKSRLILANLTTAPQTFTLTASALETSGAPRSPATVTVERTLPPFGRLDERIDAVFNLSGPDLVTGYIKWDTRGNTPGFIGFVEYGAANASLLSAIPAQGTSYSDLFFSQVAEGLGYYTGLALLNANTQSSLVSIEVITPNGTSAARTTLTLDPGERQSRLLGEIMTKVGTQLGGYVRISATHPVFAFQLFGSAGTLDFLANVSIQGTRVEPQLSGRTVRATAGATIISRDSPAQLSLPPGALATDTAITISAPGSVPAPAGNERIVAAVDLQPAGTKFQMPVRLQFTLSAHLDPGSEIPLLILNPTKS